MNEDLSQRALIQTRDQAWQESGAKGVWMKPLARVTDPHGRSTSMVRIDPGACWDPTHLDWGLELFVVDGNCQSEELQLRKGDYVYLPATAVRALTSVAGCTLFAEEGAHSDGDDELVHVHSDATPWLPGQGKLRVMPLHAHGPQSAALVQWPDGERFLPHRHMGGEEILVLSGVFMDEHGEYPVGTWLRSPHLSNHHPFVKHETVILVKVGHLLAAQTS